MVLSAQEAALVKGSIPALRQHGERITYAFYSDLLSSNPELNDTFNDVNQATGKLSRALTNIILAYAYNIGHLSDIIPRLERVANKHCSLGIKPDQYQIVGKHLLEAFSQVLGPAWTPQLEAAWEKAYSALARMLIARESQMYRQFGTWKGWRQFRIHHKVAETDGMYSYYLTPCDGGPIPSYLPGQYISIRTMVPSLGSHQQRQYSLSDTYNPKHYRISVRQSGGRYGHREGVVSNFLARSKKVGDVIEVTHPVGEFFLTPGTSNAPLVLISAGSGATPLASMFNTITQRRDRRPISWIHCSPGRKAPFEDYVRRMARERDNIAVKFFRSRLKRLDEQAQKDGDELGRLDLASIGLEKLHLDKPSAEYFICGPQDLMRDITCFLTIQGVTEDNIKCELFETGELKR